MSSSSELQVSNRSRGLTLYPPRSVPLSTTVKSITGDGVPIRLTQASQFHIDVDSGFNEVDTGPPYSGPPLTNAFNGHLRQPDASGS